MGERLASDSWSGRPHINSTNKLRFRKVSLHLRRKALRGFRNRLYVGEFVVSVSGLVAQSATESLMLAIEFQ
jgi:hypothetical protein